MERSKYFLGISKKLSPINAKYLGSISRILYKRTYFGSYFDQNSAKKWAFYFITILSELAKKMRTLEHWGGRDYKIKNMQKGFRGKTLRTFDPQPNYLGLTQQA